MEKPHIDLAETGNSRPSWSFPNDAAFFLRFMRSIGGMVDSDGRPLHEVDFRDSIPAEEYSPSKFPDSRKGYLINISAFRQMGLVWDEITDLASAFGALTAGPDPKPSATILHLWRASLAAMFYPMYVGQRGNLETYRGPLDIPVAALFKVALDLPTTIDLLLVDGGLSEDCSPKGVAEQVISFADHEGILLNGEYACAGPRKLMLELALAFMSALPRPGPSKSRIPAIDDAYLDFCGLMTAQYVIGYWFGLSSGLLADNRSEELGLASSASLPRHPSAYERRRLYALSRLRGYDERRAAWERYEGAMSFPKPIGRQIVANYFTGLDGVLQRPNLGRPFMEAQEALETLTAKAISRCQDDLAKAHGLCFNDLDLANFWRDLPRNSEALR